MLLSINLATSDQHGQLALSTPDKPATVDEHNNY